MFKGFEEQEGTPRDIRRFERLWLLAMVSSVIVAIGMYDYSIAIVGPFVAALVNIVLFGFAAILMLYASRRCSNLARLMLPVFFLLILAYDIAHYTEMMDRNVTAYLMMGRLGLMAAAIYFLFTPASRSWFAGRPVSDEDVED